MNKPNLIIMMTLVACAIVGVSLAIISAKKYEYVCAELSHQIELKEHYKDDCLKLMNKLTEIQKNGKSSN